MLKSTLFSLSGFFFIIGITGLFFIFYHWKIESQLQKYGLVFDAGSTHTKLFIYEWGGEKINGTAVVREIAQFEKSGTPGISHFKNDSSQAAKSFDPYLEFAKKKIPQHKIQNTPLYLGATAGMRMLRASNPEASDSILNEVRKKLISSGFEIDQPKQNIRIITGAEEGLFSWITLNYLGRNKAQKQQYNYPYTLERSSTYGSLDLGGASAQITFIPSPNESMPQNISVDLKLYGQQIKIYTHSFLCYGVKEIIRNYHALLVKENKRQKTKIFSPCWLKGSQKKESNYNIFKKPCTFDSSYTNSFMEYHFVGTGNPIECQRLIEKLFDFRNCSYKEGCSFNGIYQPSVRQKNFIAFSMYFYVMDAMNLTRDSQKVSLEDFNLAIKLWCNKPWQEALTTPGLSIFILEVLCIEAIYVKTILTKGFGFSKNYWKNLDFSLTMNDTEIGWTLGFMVNRSNNIPPNNSNGTSRILFAILAFNCFIFIVVAIVCLIRALKNDYTDFNG